MFYIKYRPKKIEELDNSEVKVRLANILKTGEIPHALLFTGRKGTGKTSTARIIAKAVNCQKNLFSKQTDSFEPCNTCNNCKMVDSSSSPDVVEMDAASNRGIDEIRSIIRDSSFSPITGRYRVFIIDEAHMITPEAFNALLKTLEEPPSSVIFILATTNEEKIPVTIQSRCHKVIFGKASAKDIFSMLQRVAAGEKINIKEDVMQLITKYADYSFRDATKILEELNIQNSLSLESAQKYLGSRSKEGFIELIESGTLTNCLSWLENYINSGGSAKYLIEDILKELRLMLLSKKGIHENEEIKTALSLNDIVFLLKSFQSAYSQLKFSPIESIPIEIAVAEFYNKRNK